MSNPRKGSRRAETAEPPASRREGEAPAEPLAETSHVNSVISANTFIPTSVAIPSSAVIPNSAVIPANAGIQSQPTAHDSKAASSCRTPALNAASATTHCARIVTALELARSGQQRIVLTQPIVRSADLQSLLQLLSLASVTVVIDHFRHAELLSHVGGSCSSPVGVLIAVDVGRQSLGVRPGPDAARLAAGILSLPGLNLEGVAAAVAENDRDHSSPTVAAAMAIAIHAKHSIEQTGITCPHVVTTVEHGQSFRPTDMPSRPASLAADSSSTSRSMRGSASSIDVTDRVRSITAVVLSRPSLEWCVIDRGVGDLHPSSAFVVTRPTGASVLHGSSELTSIALSSDALDVSIGDEVLITACDDNG